MQTSPRIAVVSLRFPPAGAVDFALAGLVERCLALVRQILVRPAGTPDVALVGERPAPTLFEDGGCSHAIVVAGARRGAGELRLRADLFTRTGTAGTVTAVGSTSEVWELTTQLVLDALAKLGLRPAVEEVQRIRTPAVRSGEAFDRFIGYWRGVYGDSEVPDWDAELKAAAERGYAAAWLYRIGWSYHDDRPDPAAEQLEPLAARACEQDPFSPRAHAVRAELLRLSGRPHEALALVEKATTFAPTHVGLLVERARALRSLMRRAEATAAATTAVELAPGDPRAVVTLAGCLGDEGRQDEGLATLALGARLQPDSLLLGWAHANQLNTLRRFSEALPVAEAALARIDQLPWWRIPFKSFHLDHHDSARLWLYDVAAYAAAGAGRDAQRYAAAFYALSPEPEALGTLDEYIARLKMRARFGSGALDPGGQPDGGVSELDEYVKLTYEIQRALEAGADLNVVLAHWKLDATRWVRAQSYWGDKIGNDEYITNEYVQAQARYVAQAPPMPTYARQAAAPAAAAVPSMPPPPAAASDDGGVRSIDEWARVAAELQKAMSQGTDFPSALARLGLDMMRYQSASTYWSARIASDPELGTRYFEAFGRLL
jgi:hypothetical protein